jgi:hypothetical protein
MKASKMITLYFSENSAVVGALRDGICLVPGETDDAACACEIRIDATGDLRLSYQTARQITTKLAADRAQ